MSRRAVGWGAVALGGLALFYVTVLVLASGSAHLVEQARTDWYWLVVLIGGFGVQVALLVELRRRRRAHHGATAAAGTGAAMSATGMVACCAHHLADLLPLLGATGAATLLLDYRVPVMLVGVAATAAGIVIAGRRLRQLPATSASPSEGVACAS